MMGIDELKTFLLTPIAQVGVIIGLAEIIKRLGMESRFIPLVDVGLGLISGIEIYSAGLGYPISEGVLIGVALGLEACGLFSGCKNLFQ
jgi:hypothetical protein